MQMVDDLREKKKYKELNSGLGTMKLQFRIWLELFGDD